MEDQEKGYPVTPCMDFYKEKLKSDGSLAKFKLIILVRGAFQSKEMIGDTWSTTASMRTIKNLLEYAPKNKAKVHQLDFIGDNTNI